MEKCVNQELHQLINDRQYGFRHQRSTGDLLAYVTHVWNKLIHSFGEAHVVALNISKAFDQLWHAFLLNKLPSYGLPVKLCDSLADFLSDRKITVVVDGFSSSFHNINVGVPQGSVLAPTLFLLHINDLLSSTANPIHSFADDSTLLAGIMTAGKKLGYLFRARKYFSPSNLLTLYKAQIRPSLEYCSHIWGAAAPTTLSIFDAVQRRAIRLNGDPALTCHLQRLSHRRAELLGQLRRLWPDYAVSLLVMVLGSLGGMRNTLLSALRAIPVCRAAAHILAARMQKAVILGSLRLLRAHDTRTQ
nr:unnamed protein product [Callosobruchus chinensis]